MKHEVFGTLSNVAETDITFDEIYKKRYVPSEYIDEIKKANLLIIPDEKYRDEDVLLFPETTREFFDFVKDVSGEGIIADIASSDEDFQRIELHSSVIEVAKIIVDYAVLPIVTGIVSAFLYDLIKEYRKKPEETSAKVEIIAEETKTKKS